MTDCPLFGQADLGAEYTLRPSAYAIVVDGAGRIAVVKSANGEYLPGGGLEPGEDAEAAVARECLEECGFGIQSLSFLGRAVQLLFAPGEGYFRIEGAFYVAQPVEPTTELLADRFSWQEPTVAAKLVTRQFEQWAIRTWLLNS